MLSHVSLKSLFSPHKKISVIMCSPLKNSHASGGVCLIVLVNQRVNFSYRVSDVCPYLINFPSKGADFWKFVIKIEFYVVKNCVWHHLNIMDKSIALSNDTRDLKIKSNHFLLILFCFFYVVVEHWKKQRRYNCKYCRNRLKPISKISILDSSRFDLEDLKRGRKGHRNEERYHHSQDKIPFHARLRYRESAKPISLTPGCTGRAGA